MASPPPRLRLQLATNNYNAIAVDSRELAGELLYYLRDGKIPLFALARRDEPANTFEMTRAYRAGGARAGFVRISQAAVAAGTKTI